MSLEVWSIVTTGIVILIAIAASNRALRREISELRRETGEQIDALRREMTEQFDALRREMTEQINLLRREMSERIGDVRERLGRVEGLQEGLGFARRNPSHGKQRADKGPGDERRLPSQS